MKLRAPALLAATLALPLFASPPRARAQDVNTLKAAVVRIENTRFNEVGTGLVVKVDGLDVYIVTAAHVVRGDQNPRVYLFARPQQPLPARLFDLEEDDSKGLALLILRMDAQAAAGLNALPISLTSHLGGGESAKIIGFPSGTSIWTVEAGNIKRLEGRNLVLSGGIRSGNSGGPVILNDHVVGLVTDATQDDAYAARSESVVTYLNGIMPLLQLALVSPAAPVRKVSTFKLTLDKIEVLKDGSGDTTNWDFAVYVGGRRWIHVPDQKYTDSRGRNITAVNKNADIEVTNGEKLYIKVVGIRINGDNVRAVGEYSVEWRELAGAPGGAPALSIGIPVMVESKPISGNFIAHFTITGAAAGDPRSAVPGQPANYIEVWWPAEGRAIDRGELKIQAIVKNLRLDEYRMFVEVNGGTPVGMYDSSANYPHKEAVVDIGSLPARANASVNLSFVAKDASGKVIATRTLKVPLKP